MNIFAAITEVRVSDPGDYPAGSPSKKTKENPDERWQTGGSVCRSSGQADHQIGGRPDCDGGQAGVSRQGVNRFCFAVISEEFG